MTSKRREIDGKWEGVGKFLSERSRFVCGNLVHVVSHALWIAKCIDGNKSWAGVGRFGVGKMEAASVAAESVVRGVLDFNMWRMDMSRDE